MEWIHWAGWPFLVASVVVVVLVVSLVYTLRALEDARDKTAEQAKKCDDLAANYPLVRQDRDVAVGKCEKLEERAREMATRVDELEEALRVAREDAAREQGDVNALRQGHAALQRHAEHVRGRNAELENHAGLWHGRYEEAAQREKATLANYEGLKTSFEVRGRELAEAERQRNAARAGLAEGEKEREALRGRLADAEADGARMRRQLVALREAMAGQVQEIQGAIDGGGGAEAGAEDGPCVCGHARGGHAAAIRDAAGHGTPGQCCSEGCSCGRYESAACVAGQPGADGEAEAPPHPTGGWQCQACGARVDTAERPVGCHLAPDNSACWWAVFTRRPAPPAPGGGETQQIRSKEG
jgi:hypothetical protein